MRRDIWLAGVAGAIVGSWLTLVAIQLGEHGFSLPRRDHNATTAEADPTPPKAIEASKPIETAKQDDRPPNRSQPEVQATAQPAASAAEAAKGKPTILATAASSTGSDGGPELSAAAMAAAAAAAPASGAAEKARGGNAAKAEESKTPAVEAVALQENKVPTDPARLNDMPAKPEEPAPAAADMTRDKDIASSQAPQPATPDKAAATASATASAEQAKTNPLPDNRIPADQIDREAAAAEHRTLPPPTQQQADSKPEPDSQSEQAALDPASKPQEQTTTVELVRPFSDQAGILTLAGRSVQLDGIIPTDVDRMCLGSNGKSWPCGQAARTAFRMYLRGRSIDCDVPDASWKGTVKGECRYVRVDLGAWLVRFGWADPEPGSPLAALVDEAKQKKRGMYGDDPRKDGKSTLAPPPPKEDPLNPI